MISKKRSNPHPCEHSVSTHERDQSEKEERNLKVQGLLPALRFRCATVSAPKGLGNGELHKGTCRPVALKISPLRHRETQRKIRQD